MSENVIAVLRDASVYRTHRHTVTSNPDTWHIPKYHVATDETATETACGRAAAEFTATDDLDEWVPLRRRCQRPGCRERWPA